MFNADESKLSRRRSQIDSHSIYYGYTCGSMCYPQVKFGTALAAPLELLTAKGRKADAVDIRTMIEPKNEPPVSK